MTAGHFQRHAPKTADHHGPGVNGWVAQKLADGLATMWCAYVFAAIALLTLPTAIKGGLATIVPWLSQTFIQLVFLAVLAVIGKVLGAAQDAQTAHIAAGIDAALDRLDVRTEGGLADLRDEVLAAINQTGGAHAGTKP